MASTMAASEHAEELKLVTLNTFLHVLDDKARPKMNRSFSDSDLSSTTGSNICDGDRIEDAAGWAQADVANVGGLKSNSSGTSAGSSADQFIANENNVGLHAYMKLSPEELAHLLPEDSEGNAASIGSIAHDDGSCLPCSFFARSRGCREGMYCQFCHLSHSKEKKPRHRPCKGQRLHFSRTLDRLKSRVEQDPDGFDIEQVDLPPSIACNDKWRSKIMEKVSQLVLDLKDTPQPTKEVQ